MDRSFSKNDTLAAKGAAIIFLIFYHCLSSESRLMGYSVDFAPMAKEDAFLVFESMNICVGMFAFLSSFGLMKTINKKYLGSGREKLDAKSSSVFIAQRTISLIGAFFIPYIICTLISLLVFQYNPYGEADVFALNMICDMLGLAGILGTSMMVRTWWYMSFALVIIALMPITFNLYKKYGLAVLVPYLVFPLLIDLKFYNGSSVNNMTRWLLTIPLGIIFADCDLFEKLKNRTITKNKYISVILKFIICTALLAGAFWLRKQMWCWMYLYYVISSVLPVIFIYWLYAFVCDIPVLKNILAFFGRYSSDIFFMHTFVRLVWFPWLTYSFGTWYGVFLFMMGVSLAMAVVTDLLRKLVRWDKFVGFLSAKGKTFVGYVMDKRINE